METETDTIEQPDLAALDREERADAIMDGPTAQAEPPRKPLEWVARGPDEQATQWCADSSIGILEGGILSENPAWYAINEYDNGGIIQYEIDEYPGERADGMLDAYPTLKAAQDFCEARDAELYAKAHPAPPECIDVTDADTSASQAPRPIGSRTETPIDEVPVTVQRWHEIQSARRDERGAEERVEELSAELKEAKKDLEAASKRLGALIDDAERCATEPMLPGLDGKACAKTCENIPDPIPVVTPDESWKLVTLTELKFPAAVLKGFSAAKPPLETLGQLAEWTAAPSTLHGGVNELKDLPGVGEKKAEAAEEVLLTYWREHPQKTLQENTNESSRNNDSQQVAGTNGFGRAGSEGSGGNESDGAERSTGRQTSAGGSLEVGGAAGQPGDDPVRSGMTFAGVHGDACTHCLRPFADHEPPALACPDPKAEVERGEWVLNACSISGEWVVMIRADLYSDGSWGFYANAGTGDFKGEFDNAGFSTKAAAVTAGADSIQAWIRALPPKAKRGDRGGYVKAIVSALDDLDKRLAGEAGSAESENKAAVAEAVSA